MPKGVDETHHILNDGGENEKYSQGSGCSMCHFYAVTCFSSDSQLAGNTELNIRLEEIDRLNIKKDI